MAANEFHARMSGVDVHGIIRWTVASYADLESLPVLDEDVGKVALVAEDNSLHALVMVTPEGATWRRLDNAAGLMLSSTEPATLDSSSTASAGVAAEAARADHVHALDLPDPILLSDADPLAVSAQEGWSAGTAPEAARADHRHALSTLVAWDVSSLGEVGPDPGDRGKLARVEVDGNISFYVLARDQPENVVWLRIDNEEFPAQLALSDATPTTLDTLTPASAGTSVEAARADHTHALDLPAPYVLAETTPTTISATAAGAAGTQYVVARADHRHAIDTAAPVAVGAANAPGTSSALARADHVHDASSKADVAWVTTQLNGKTAIGTGTPSTVDPNTAASAGVANTAAPFDHRHSVATAAPVAVGAANAIGSSSALARADHVHDASGLRLPIIRWTGWSNGTAGWSQVTSDPAEGEVALVDGRISIAARTGVGDTPSWKEIAYSSDVAAIDTRLATSGVPSQVGAASAIGAATSFARSDHVHKGKRWIWTWSGAAARNATSVSAADLGNVGFQQDIQREYVLLGVSPTRWGELPDASLSFVRFAVAAVGSTALSMSGLNGPFTPTGTVAARTAISGQALTRAGQLPRLAWKSATTANSYALMRTQGSTSNPYAGAGFRAKFVYVLGAVTTAMQWAFGFGTYMSFSGAGQSPNTMVSAGGYCLSLACYLGQPNVSLLSSGTAGTATAVDLGASFPARTAETAYELEVYTADGLSYGWQARNVGSGAEVSGSISGATAPASTAFLQWGLYATNGTDAAEVALDLSQVTIGNVVR